MFQASVRLNLGSGCDQRVEIDHRFSLFRVERAEISRIIWIVCAGTETADDLTRGVDRSARSNFGKDRPRLGHRIEALRQRTA